MEKIKQDQGILNASRKVNNKSKDAQVSKYLEMDFIFDFPNYPCTSLSCYPFKYFIVKNIENQENSREYKYLSLLN